MPILPSREVRLLRRPVGMPTADCFEIVANPAPEPAEGEIQVRNAWLSVDPYMRGRMIDQKSYVPPFALGEAMQGGAVGTVVASRAPGFQPGDTVLHMLGWREAVTAPAAGPLGFRKVDASGLPAQAFLSVAGMPGFTAWAGLLEIGKPKPGETVFVSGAAGAVGSLVCQIAKLHGARVVGSAGSDEKCRYLTERLGIDAAINYRTAGDLKKALAAAAPKGIDVFFDNVGGAHLEAAIAVARPFARLVCCGMIDQYNDAAARPGPSNLVLIISKRLTLRGFIVFDFAGEEGRFLTDVTGWIRENRIVWEETVFEGIARMPDAFLGLFSGANTGKMLVKV